jgi:hypothetical protein
MSPALAEDSGSPPAATGSEICWVAGLAFSPGASIRTGFAVSICRRDGTWAETKTGPAGCLKNGQLFATGSSDDIGAVKNGKQTCQKDGTWS